MATGSAGPPVIGTFTIPGPGSKATHCPSGATDSNHKQRIYPNLRPLITPEGPDELWVADLTYIRLTTGFVFLAVVLDVWS